MGTSRHNPGEISFTWAALNFTGMADDDFISIERTTEATSSSVDARGNVVVQTINDDRKQITLRLIRNSKDNAILSGIYQTQRTTGNVLIAPMTIKDGLGQDLHVAPEAWIMNEPNADYGAETGIREWVFEAAKMTSFHGGS